MSAHLRLWAAALGGDVCGNSVRAPGPGHSARDRSLFVTPSIAAPNGFLVHSFAGDDSIVCLDYVRARLGMPAFAPQRSPLAAVLNLSAEPLTPIGARQQQASEPAPEPNPNTDRARTIWRASGEIKGTAAAAYLASRGLPLDENEDWHRVLRFHPACPFGSERAPGMIALMRDIVTDAPKCIQRTRLTPDGRKIDRQMLGPAKGAAIKIDADADVTMGLCIGEGLETCLTGRQLGIKPVWALGSVGAIAAFPVLGGIRALSIHSETGAASAKAVGECGDRWDGAVLDDEAPLKDEAPREVYVLWPKGGDDINDALREVAQ
jgi:putative DNA primase/helicase